MSWANCDIFPVVCTLAMQLHNTFVHCILTFNLSQFWLSRMKKVQWEKKHAKHSVSEILMSVSCLRCYCDILWFVTVMPVCPQSNKTDAACSCSFWSEQLHITCPHNLHIAPVDLFCLLDPLKTSQIADRNHQWKDCPWHVFWLCLWCVYSMMKWNLLIASSFAQQTDLFKD